MSLLEMVKAPFRTVPYWTYLGLFVIMVFLPFTVINTAVKILANIPIGLYNFLIALLEGIVNVLLIGLFGIFNLLVGFINTVIISPINTILSFFNSWSFSIGPYTIGPYGIDLSSVGGGFVQVVPLITVVPALSFDPFNFTLITAFTPLSTSSVGFATLYLSYYTSNLIISPYNNIIEYIIGTYLPGVFPI